MPEDIIATLQAMGVLEDRKRGGADAVINKARVRAWVDAHKIKLINPIDPEGFRIEEEESAEAAEE